MIIKNKRIVIGRIVGVHGVKGYLKILSFTDNKNDFFIYSPYFINNKKIQTISFLFKTKEIYICQLNDCKDRNTAKTFVNKDILIEVSRLPILTSGDEYYQQELLGFKTVNAKSEVLGYVKEFHNFGAGLVCEVTNNTKSYFLPFDKNFLIDVNIDEKKITLDLSLEIIKD